MKLIHFFRANVTHIRPLHIEKKGRETFKLTVNGLKDVDRYWQLGQDTDILREDIHKA